MADDIEELQEFIMVDSFPESTGSCQVQGRDLKSCWYGTDDAPADVQLYYSIYGPGDDMHMHWML